MSSSSTAAPAPTRPSLDGEFIPPLEYQDTWGRSWCVQLKSLQAWQEAGGNTDGQACQWREPADTSPPPVLTKKRGRHGRFLVHSRA